VRIRLGHLVVAAAAGAIGGAAGAWVAAAWHPGVAFEMDRDLPAIASGFYASERNDVETWVWSAPRAELRLHGVDRRVAWECTIRFRGGRPPDEPLPRVDLAVDGVTIAAIDALNEHQDATVTAPAMPGRRGLVLGLSTSETFVPSGDPRPLGVLVDRIACAPGGVVLPPAGATARASLAAAVFGVAFVLAGAGAAAAAAGALGVATAQTVPLAIAPALFFDDYWTTLLRLALWTGLVLVVVARLVRWRGRRSLDSAALFVLAFSAVAVYFKLLGLLHPGKPIVDALYHAHRLQRVLAGQFYFTQIMPEGVEFPYAVALYVFAAPWTWLSADLVTVLRVVVCGVEAASGVLLYLMVVRIWGDRFVGALAVVLFHLAALPYEVIGNANFTNAFGAAAALAAVAAAVVLPLPAGQWRQWIGLTLLALVAMLSHVGTFGLMGVMLVALAAGYRAIGGASLGAPARRVFLAAIAAAVLSIGLYWGHFPDTYRTLARVRSDARAASITTPGRDAGAPVTPSAADRTSLSGRFAYAMTLAPRDFGWPMLVAALIGVWRLLADRRRDRLSIAIAAWAAVHLVFFTFGVVVPVNVRYERYAAEFIGRVELATYPGLVLLAAVGLAWMWRTGRAGRIAALALVAALAHIVSGFWLHWLE
jgi:hypothetical protein